MFCLKDFMYVLSFSLRIYSLHVTRSAGKLQVWSHLVKKPLMKNFISCAVQCIPSAQNDTCSELFPTFQSLFIVIIACKGKLKETVVLH